MDFDLMIHNIKNDIPFKYARYGDGEWNCILGKKGKNCDGHEYFPDLGERLKSILESKPDYYLGLQNIARHQNQFNSEFRRLVDKNDWIDNEILHRASINGYLSLFFEALRDKFVILVGPRHFAGFCEKNNWQFIQVDRVNCWRGYKEVRNMLLLKSTVIDDFKILLCSSMMSEVLIDDFKNKPQTFIDCGSVLDPYCGVNSRTYHHNLKI